MEKLLAILAGLAIGAAPLRSSGQASHLEGAQKLADRVVELLVQGDTLTVATRMHYPSTYTLDERNRDISSVGDGLALSAREFGALTSARLQTDSATFYEVGISGGDVAYLSSLSPHYSIEFLYETAFSKLGNGYIHMRIIQLTSNAPFEVLSMNFALPGANPRAKSNVARVMRKQLVRMKVPITPDLERKIDNSLKPVYYRFRAT